MEPFSTPFDHPLAFSGELAKVGGEHGRCDDGARHGVRVGRRRDVGHGCELIYDTCLFWTAPTNGEARLPTSIIGCFADAGRRTRCPDGRHDTASFFTLKFVPCTSHLFDRDHPFEF